MTTLEYPTAIDEPALQLLQASIRGLVINQQHPEYEEARKVYNGSIDKHPALIIKCRDIADVIYTVNFARDKRILLAVRGGGHNGAGLGICDDGIVLDLSLMRGVRVDPLYNTVRVEGGCQLGDMDHATHAFGRAVPCGINATTGIGGLALGGGLGYLTRKYGLTIDSLLEADMVLADGRFITVSANQHEDLFWAIRGGGGNFGVVTSFLFKTHPVSTVYAGPMIWPLEDSKELMQWYNKFIKEAPNDLYGFFTFLTVPPVPLFPEQLHNKTFCGVVWCYTGPMENAEKEFKSIRAFKKSALDYVGPMPLLVLQSMFDAFFPTGMQWYWKADFVDDLTDEVIDIHLKHGTKLPSLLSTMHLYPINGVGADAGKKDTAWNYRGATWAMVIAGIDAEPTNREKVTTWAKEYWNELHPHGAGGAYINFMMEEGDDRVKATYGENHKRLVEIKKKYDPENLFRVNQNIKP